MHKPFLVIPALLATLLTLALTARANTLDEIKALGEIRLGMSADYDPFYYLENGQLKGFEIDLGNALAAKLGVKPVWKRVAFDSLFPALNAFKLDAIIASHTITPERSKLVDFTTPHYCGGLVILTNSWGPRTLTDLKGRTVGAVSSTVGRQYAVKLTGLKALVSYKTEDDAVTGLLQGKADALIVSKFIALAAVKKIAATGKILAYSRLLTTDRVAMAVRKFNPGVREALSNALKALQNDGTYKRLSQKWFGDDIRCS
jgi:polar amino acid transport system substrate-binding protein